MSTRKTKPWSVRWSSRRMNKRPRRWKYSSLAVARAPSVSPSSANSRMRSMSEEKFSSRPPSLPMPSTIIGTLAPERLRGVPKTGDNRRAAMSLATRIAASAKSDRSCSVSATPARPTISRQAMRSSSRRRQTRSSNTASASVLAAMARASASPLRAPSSRCQSQVSAPGSCNSAAAANSLAASTRGSSASQRIGRFASKSRHAGSSAARSNQRRTGARSGSGVAASAAKKTPPKRGKFKLGPVGDGIGHCDPYRHRAVLL